MAAGTENAGGADSARRLMVWAGAAGLMLLPLLAMRGIDAAAWDPPGDLVFLAILLAGAGGAYELAARVSDRGAYRAAIAFALAAALLQSWINLAVGIIGSEDNPANWIYAGVLAVAAAGAILARFKPLGMAHAMTAAAAAQVAAFALALAAGLGPRVHGPDHNVLRKPVANLRLAVPESGAAGRCGERGLRMVPRDGIEPPTLRFSVACSTN